LTRQTPHYGHLVETGDDPPAGPRRIALHRALGPRLLAALLLIGLLPLLIAGALGYRPYVRTFQEKVRDQLGYRAELQLRTISLFLEERRAVLAAAADLHRFEDLTDEDYLSRLLGVLNARAGAFTDLGVIDMQGVQRAYVGPFRLRGLDYREQPWFREVMSRGLHISDVFEGYRERPHFVVAVRRHQGGHTWILRAAIDSDIFAQVVRAAQVGDAGDAFILNALGEYQIRSRFDHYRADSLARFVERFGPTISLVEMSTPEGGARLYAGVWMAQPRWLLVLSTSKAGEMDALAAARDVKIRAFVLTGFGVVIAAFLLTRWIGGRLMREEAAFDAAKARITHSDKLSALGKLAVGVAHEINNPLAIISQRTGLLSELIEADAFRDEADFQEFQAGIQKIEFQVGRVQEVVQNLLTYARKMEPVRDDVDVNALVNQTAERLGEYARLNGIALELRLAEKLPVIASNKSQLQQVFFNLMSNAMDAVSGPEGAVTAETRLAGPTVEVEIADNGPGIAAEMRERIFDPFFTTKASGEGLGLGLWVSHNILTRLGCEIEVKNRGGSLGDPRAGKGTAFVVRIPAVRPERK
jgi:two-component system NtrC family sensor kinase